MESVAVRETFWLFHSVLPCFSTSPLPFTAAPMKMGYRVCVEADQSFLSINSTFLRDHFSFSKAPNIKEQINKRPLESIFQVLTHAFWLPTNFKILFCIVLVKRDNLYRGSLTK